MLTLPVMAARRFDKYGILHFQDISRYRMPEQKPSKPLANAFITGGFLFGPGSIVNDIPYDPNLYFCGGESAFPLDCGPMDTTFIPRIG